MNGGNVINDNRTIINPPAAPVLQQFEFDLRVSVTDAKGTKIPRALVQVGTKTYDIDENENTVPFSFLEDEDLLFEKQLILSAGIEYETKEVDFIFNAEDKYPQLNLILKRKDLNKAKLFEKEYELFHLKDSKVDLYWTKDNIQPENTDSGVCIDNNPANCAKYGGLFNYQQAYDKCKNMSPGNWRLPTKREADSYASFDSILDFSLGGYRKHGDFNGIDKIGYYWLFQSESEKEYTNGRTALAVKLDKKKASISISDYNNESLFSCKCVRAYDDI